MNGKPHKCSGFRSLRFEHERRRFLSLLSTRFETNTAQRKEAGHATEH